MNREIQSAVITGPTGAVGTALCRVLSEAGVRAFAVVRPGSIRVKNLDGIDGTEIIECDLSEMKRLPGLVPSADAFYHLAWAGTTGAGRNDMDAQIKNVQYAIDAVRAAKRLNCRVFVGAGSQAEYGRAESALTPQTPCFPENGYGMAKLCAGQMSRVECEKLGIDHIWPRILSVYGPCDGPGSMIMGTISGLLGGKRPSLTAGEQLWDYLYADDAARALYLMALHGASGAVYPLGSGQSRPLREYIEALRDAIDPALPLGLGEVPYGQKQVMVLKADISALHRDTGFLPQTDFTTGIQRTIEWMRRQHG